MELGIVREVTPQERRVAITPEGVRVLVAAGHGVVVETGAGAGAGYTDTDYVAAGASIAFTARELAARVELMVKIHAPGLDELDLVRPGMTLLAFLHLAAAPRELPEAIIRREATALAMELVCEGPDDYPLLQPLSALGGRLAITLAAYHLTVPGNGPGLLLGGGPGVPPAMVVVVGGGSAGQAAAAEAAAHGAQVVVLDRDPRKLARLEKSIGRVAITAISTEYNLARYLEQADVVIGAVAVRGEPAPKVIRRQHVRMMKEGSLLIDMSIDEGGCAETSRPTTPESPIYVEEGVRHLCVPNLPSEVARTASRTLASSLLPYLVELGEGVDQALARYDALRASCLFYRGKLVNRRLLRFVGAPLENLDEIVPVAEER